MLEVSRLADLFSFWITKVTAIILNNSGLAVTREARISYLHINIPDTHNFTEYHR